MDPAGTTADIVDPLAAAGMALASAFREADALFHLGAVHNPGLATAHAQRLRDALLLAMLGLGEARRARRRASQAPREISS